MTNFTIMKSAEKFRASVGPDSNLSITTLLSRRNEGMRLFLRTIFHSMSKLTTTKALHNRNVRDVTTKPRHIRQLASECSQIMAGVYYVVTLAT